LPGEGWVLSPGAIKEPLFLRIVFSLWDNYLPSPGKIPGKVTNLSIVILLISFSIFTQYFNVFLRQVVHKIPTGIEFGGILDVSK
jgi:hypothetical protein